MLVRPSGRPVLDIGWPLFLACSPLMQVTDAGACVEQAGCNGTGQDKHNFNRGHRRLIVSGQCPSSRLVKETRSGASRRICDAARSVRQ